MTPRQGVTLLPNGNCEPPLSRGSSKAPAIAFYVARQWGNRVRSSRDLARVFVFDADLWTVLDFKNSVTLQAANEGNDFLVRQSEGEREDAAREGEEDGFLNYVEREKGMVLKANAATCFQDEGHHCGRVRFFPRFGLFHLSMSPLPRDCCFSVRAR